jgi:hypothetical protein
MTEGIDFMAMEVASGETVDSILRQRRLSIRSTFVT